MDHPADQMTSSDETPTGNPVLYRQAIAVLALLASLVALYLHLVKIGVFGIPSCGPGGGGCVQAWYSPWGTFLGMDVALIGAVGYAVLAVVAFVGTLPSREDDGRLTQLMLLLIVAAVAFTWRLKYGEWVRMQIFCIWCFQSFVTIHLCLWLVWRDRARIARST